MRLPEEPASERVYHAVRGYSRSGR